MSLESRDDDLMAGIRLFWEQQERNVYDPAIIDSGDLFATLEAENRSDAYRLGIFPGFNRETYAALLRLLDNPMTGKKGVREDANKCLGVLQLVIQEIDLADPHSGVGKQLHDTYQRCVQVFGYR